MKIFVLNAGSSSLKYRLFDAASGDVAAAGLVERIGEIGGGVTHEWREDGEPRQRTTLEPIPDHRAGLKRVFDLLRETGTLKDEHFLGIGHRVVHGGERFREPVIIDREVVRAIRETIPLAPLHNPANLMGIEAALELYPGVPQVAVFDTAFHQTMPPHAYHYALPHALYSERHVRRYGFHGTSHAFLARAAAAHLARPVEQLNLITLHLGNGASAAAIADGRSMDTSMGMTPLEGLIMGTRCGDLDPAMHFYLAREAGVSWKLLEDMLTHESGLKGICGANDMREVLRLAEAGDARARLAVDMYCYRVRKYIGAYYAVLGRVDALVFAGGVGENAAPIRAQCCGGLENLGIAIDGRRNEGAAGLNVREIQSPAGRVKVLVIRTDEEREIARQTIARIQVAREAGAARSMADQR